MKTKVLITGAAGFVGSRILEDLAKDTNLEVSVLLREPARLKKLTTDGIDVYKGDITKPDSLRGPLSGQEVIIHCAALMSNFDFEPRERFFDVNVRGTENILISCDLKRLRHFIHISTAGVYGATGQKLADENTPYGNRLSVYEWSKAQSELVVLKYAKKENLPFTILRPSQLYGAGMRYGWPQTISSIKSGTMLMPGKGDAKIHMLDVRDLVRAARLIILNRASINQIYNVAGPEILSLREVFGIIAKITGTKPPKRIPYMPIFMGSFLLSLVPRALKNDRLRLLTPHRVRFFATDHVYDISKVKDDLGFNPKIDAKSGLRDMVN